MPHSQDRPRRIRCKSLLSNEISHEVKFLITKFELGEIFSIDFFPEVTFVKDVYIEHRFVTGDIESSV